MSFFIDSPSSSAMAPGTANRSLGGTDPSVPLHNLSTVHSRMVTLQKFLSDSINSNTLISKHQMDMVSSEIASAIHQIIVNSAAILSFTQNPTIPSPKSTDFLALTQEKQLVDHPKIEVLDEEDGGDYEIIEMDVVELLAEHIHLCEICGKGFKRDANLRMHMRAHGNQFKTPEALAKPEKSIDFSFSGRVGGDGEARKTRFSCPYVGCNRNKKHKKFRPLKSVICVKNHFKRSHCPKMYNCNRCNKKSFSVVADLKSHMKHCGETKWKCSCGTCFSRKDKLFGHMALFEGHMPAVAEEEEEDEEEEEQGHMPVLEAEKEKGKEVVVLVEDDDDEEDLNLVGKQMEMEMEMEMEKGVGDNEFFDGLLDGFCSIDNYCLQDLLGSPSPAAINGLGSGLEGFFNF